MKYVDMSGVTVGRLTCLEPVPAKGRPTHWRCKCACGGTAVVRGAALRNGNTTSCGCYRVDVATRRATKHGMCKHPAYESYNGARGRCRNPNDRDYLFYGGRGIKFRLPEFLEFWESMGDTWFAGATLDRIDNEGDYVIGNIRWASRRDQCLNTRRAVKIEFNGVTKNLCEWASDLGITPSTLRERLQKWELKRALTTLKIWQN